MAKLIILLSFLLSFEAYSAEWKIITDDSGKSYLQNKNISQKKFEIKKAMGKSNFIRAKKINKEYQLLIYVSGVAGTSNIVQLTNAAIFNTKTKSIIGDYPYAYISLTENKKIAQPKWIIKKNEILIKDESIDLNKKIILK